MSGLESNDRTQMLEPSSRFGARNGKYYPDQFFDISQQFMPSTIKELFKWCTFYFYNSPLIGSTIRKISRYPITDLIAEDSSDKIKNVWEKIFNKHLKIKKRLLEINLDYYAYGNAFVSLHLPFTRFLTCPDCGKSDPIDSWNWRWAQGDDKHGFHGSCKKCNYSGPVKVKDTPYKDFRNLNVVRWNPTNMIIKYNDYTGKRIFLYNVPRKLQSAIKRGDKDILKDIPLVVLRAVQDSKLIRFNEDQIFHLKMPSLAEQDQGWGKPLIIHVLKDMFYLYTLRRAQEAIALEHIVPFDIIYPLPNAGIDPYQHVSLGSWRTQIESAIKKHRDDPNFKAVFPIPVGLQRMGGDGKILMLGPEINNLNQMIVGGMGIPQEFLFGGLNWTGSSVSLRTLENDFIQNRTDMQDMLYWMKDKIRAWFELPDCDNLRFTSFRMADDVQKNQQLIGLNAQFKVSDQTMLTELGYDWDQEQKRMAEEVYFQNYLNDLRTKGSAKTQGEASIISFNYQNKVQELATKAQASAQKRVREFTYGSPNKIEDQMPQNQYGGQEEQADPAAVADGQAPADQAGPSGAAASEQAGSDSGAGAGARAGAGADPEQADVNQAMQGGEQASETAQEQVAPGANQDTAQSLDGSGGADQKVESMASQLAKMDPQQAQTAIQQITSKFPELGQAVNKRYNEMRSGLGQPGQGAAQGAASQGGVDMTPLPENGMPRRQGAV